MEKFEKAWSIVDPTNAGNGRDWRDPIVWMSPPGVYSRQCEALGVKHADVMGAIRFYTATEPTVRTDKAGNLVIRAAGYRNGPAGP